MSSTTFQNPNTPMALPPFAWGKYSAVPAIWLPLTDHMADVAACFAALIRLPLYRARLAAAIGHDPDLVTIERLCVLAYLHDLGKLSSAFQARAMNPGLKAGHTAQGWQVFSPEGQAVARALALPEMANWGEAADRLLLAALAHHGRPINGGEIAHAADWKPRDGYDPVQAATVVGRECRARYPLAFGPGPELPHSPELQHFFAGLVALADQIGSREDDFPLDRQNAAPQDAAEVLRRIRVDVTALRDAFVEAPLTRLFGWLEKADARPMQKALADLPLHIRLAVLESETGSGKTEAAFLRFLRLFAAGLVDGLYFAVPTRAAATQIHNRINRAAREAFRAECFLALPGYLKAGEAEGWALPDWRVEWSDDPDAAQREARWSAETPRRFLAAPVAVGTVDQVMLAGLQVKWAHLRAATLARSYLVIDEVHASDSYMSAVVECVVCDHVARGGHALLMSATLGAATRAKFLGGPQAKPDRHPAYPALSWTEGRKETHIAPGGPDRQKTVEVTSTPLIADPEAIACAALDAARKGARVLVIRNTVDQVVAVQHAIEALDPAAPLLSVNGIPCPHHGRFAAEDRHLLDAAVEEAMGKSSPAGGRIVCGSQTLEQSLDIDADYLITDLCPIDILLQRIGRLHRHARQDRPAGFGNARCVVLLPALLEPVAGLLRFGLGANREGGGVYPDITGLEAVRRLIGTGATWTIPEDNRKLVEAGTDPETLDRLAEELGTEWTAARGRMIGSRIAKGQIARLNLIDRSRAFDGTADDCFPEDVKILTRIGADRVQVPFADGTVGPFGATVTQISVPGHWPIDGLADASGKEWRESGPGCLAFDAAGLVYDRFGLSHVSN
ncbi:CRISPR-associated helicase Cas3' [Pseudochelatococcus sp. B33]